MTCRAVAVFTFVAGLLFGFRADAALVTYDASSGLPPESVGWVYHDEAIPPATVTVSGGVLNLGSTLENRAFWDIDLVGFGASGSEGMFMESTLRINSESHSVTGRGMEIITLGRSDGVTGSSIAVYAWEDRIFVQDTADTTVGTHFLDTTDGFHTYRAEILDDAFWIFVDNVLVLSGSTPIGPFGTPISYAKFGDGSEFSDNNTDWTTIVVGTLDEIGGPSIPEPSSLTLLALGACGIAGRGLRRRVRKQPD